MSPHWKAVLGVIFVFFFGCASGWLGSSMLHYRQTAQILRGNPDVLADLLERRMTRNLGVDETQKAQIRDFLMENLRQRRQLQTQIQPQIQVLNQRTLKEINAVLRADQVEQLHQNLVEFRQRFGKNPFNPNADSQPPPVGTSSRAGANPANPAP